MDQWKKTNNRMIKMKKKLIEEKCRFSYEFEKFKDWHARL